MGQLFSPESIETDLKHGHKILLDQKLIIHCHHYNSRLQRTIQDCPQVDGKNIFKDSVARSFFDMLSKYKVLKDESKTDIAEDLFSFLGFGCIDLKNLIKGEVTSSSSHFVEGWKCGSIKKEDSVCTFTEGYLIAALKYVTGFNFKVSETECMNQGCSSCKFSLEKTDENLDFTLNKSDLLNIKKIEGDESSNIDKEAIVKAVMGLPLAGNDEGLIPAFNVYLGLMPQDVYNLMCIRFVEEMAKANLRDLAINLLIEDAENCALNTFNGILNSDEWAGLIAPMVKDQRDQIFGLVAVANALGWGRISVLKHSDEKELILTSTNGYEAIGYLEINKINEFSKCYMLTGIASGLMALIYEKGEIEDRSGSYAASENECLCKGDDHCRIVSRHAA